jgi:hypothetical protein
MKVALRAGLPSGKANGLEGTAAEFIGDKKAAKLVIGLVSLSRVVEDEDSAETIAQLKLRRVEVVVDGDDLDTLRRIMLRAYEQRTPDQQLPYQQQAIPLSELFREFAEGHLDGPKETDSPQQTDETPGYSTGEPPDEDGPWPGDPGFSG